MIKVENPANRKEEFLRAVQTVRVVKSTKRAAKSRGSNISRAGVDIIEDEQFAFSLALNLRAAAIPGNIHRVAGEFARSIRGGEPRLTGDGKVK